MATRPRITSDRARRLLLIVLAVVGSWLLAAPAVHAAAGDPDPTFNGGAVLGVDFGQPDDEALATVVQPDGKILVAGYTFDGTKNVIAVARFDASGAPDPTWGTGPTTGLVTLPVGVGNSSAEAIALSGAQVVIAGYGTWGGTRDFVVARFNSDGSLDTGGFGASGYVTLNLAADDTFNGVAVNGDGSVVAAGTGNGNFVVKRFTSVGGIDGTWTATPTDFFGLADVARDVAIEPSGKVLVSGYATDGGGNQDFAVVRYNANGSLDTNVDADPSTHWSTDGKLTLAVGSGNDVAFSVARDSIGKVVVAGVADMAGDDDIAVVRFNSDGSLDTNADADPTTDWSADGIEVRPSAAGPDIARSLVIDSSDRAIVAGSAFVAPSFTKLVVLRYDEGVLDPAWGTSGTVLASGPAGADAMANAVAMDPSSGNVVVAGGTWNGADMDTMVMRYLGDPVAAATSLDMTGCMALPALDFGSVMSGAGYVTSSDCEIVFGSPTDTSMLRVFQQDGVSPAMLGPAGATVSDYGVGGTWSGGTNMFGACLRQAASGAATSGATWPTDFDGDCADGDADPWRAIPATAAGPGSVIATAPSGSTIAAARLRFGVRTSSSQLPGSYVANLQFEVVAPSI